MSKVKKRFVSGFGGKHNDLFGPGPNHRLNACVGRNGGPAGFDRYARGYFEAGARLVKSLQEEPLGVDCVIYPLVMVYRHGVEVALKHLLRLLPFLCDDETEIEFTHKLTDNWCRVRGYLAKLEFDADDLSQVDRILKDLVEIDSNGETFRYPESKPIGKGEDKKEPVPYLQETSLINVEVFGDGMSHVANYFEFACDMVDDYVQSKCEMDQENARAQHEMDRDNMGWD